MSRLVLEAFTFEFRKTKEAAEKAFAQLRDDDFHFKLHTEQCSIATYIRHMAGNMRSRWTDFLTTDGEKPDRNREGEFLDYPHSREPILRIWNDGWSIVFATLDSLTDDDLPKTVTIRTEPHTVALAISRQLAHYAWHVGQIILLAKHLVALRGDKWEYITIAPGGSGAFNVKKGMSAY
jgi:hypothetical protein